MIKRFNGILTGKRNWSC